MALEWINPLCGGALISFSLCTFIAINGSSCGIGHMLKSILERDPSHSWNNQIIFLIGLIISPITYTVFFHPITGEPIKTDPLVLIFSGLLVGTGYKLSNGGVITQTVLVGFLSNKNSLIATLLILFFGGLSHLMLDYFLGLK